MDTNADKRRKAVLANSEIANKARAKAKKVSNPCIEVPSFINVRLLNIERAVEELMYNRQGLSGDTKENLYLRIQDIRRKLKAIQFQQFYTSRPSLTEPI